MDPRSRSSSVELLSRVGRELQARQQQQQQQQPVLRQMRSLTETLRTDPISRVRIGILVHDDLWLQVVCVGSDACL